MEKATTTDKLKELRKSKDAGSGIEFKKVAFKGYDCKEVDEYIISLKNNMELSEKAFNDRLEEASSTSSMYLQECDKLKQKLSETDKITEQIRFEARDLIEREKAASANINKENENLKSTVKSLREKIDEYELNRMSFEQEEVIKQKNAELEANIDELKEKYNELITINEEITHKNVEFVAQINDLNEKMDNTRQQTKQKISELTSKTIELNKLNEEITRKNMELANQINGLNEKMDTARQQAEQKISELTSEITELNKAKDVLTIENVDFKATANKALGSMEKISKENEELKKALNASLVSKRYQAMSTNMKIFEYMKNYELNLESITGNLNEVLKAVDLIKQDSLELFEKTKIDIDQEPPLEKTV